MPGNVLTADMALPDLQQYDTVERKLTALENYLLLLLENLRYTLRNLSTENFNDAALSAFVKELRAGTVTAGTVVTDVAVADELYAGYGSIAALTVDKLRTDFQRSQRYLAGNTDPIDYLSIHDETIEFITATTDGSRVQQLQRDGKLFFWTDETCTQMTAERTDGQPVLVYVYDELVKAAFRFDQTVLSDGTVTAVPLLKLGAGDAGGTRQGTIVKLADRMEISYESSGGKKLGMTMDDSGFTDITGLRKTSGLNFSQWSNGTFRERVEGLSDVFTYGVEFDAQGRPIQITDSDGHTMTVSW